jgi:hypothetical protein
MKIAESKLNPNIEYMQSKKGLTIRDKRKGDLVFISKGNTDAMIRIFSEETINEIIELMPSVFAKECRVCHKIFYTQYKQQRNCSKECSREAGRESDRRCKETKRLKALANTSGNTDIDKEIADATDELKGLSYGKRKALKFMKENREALWGSLYAEIEKAK